MIIDKLAWLCIKNKKLLVVRSHNKEVFYIPGGKRDSGESDITALCREIEEELSVKLIHDTILYATTITAQAHAKPLGTEVKITSYFAEYKGELKINNEIAELAWVDSTNQHITSMNTQMIIQWLISQKMLV